MVLSDLSIRRPVLASVMSLALVLLGLICFERLPVREYPDIDVPVVSVRTVLKGASAEVMEEQISQTLEDSLSGIEGIKTLKSVSREEVSQITIEFHLERDPDAAAAEVRDRVARVRGRLPDEVEEPIVSKIDADAQAILWLAFSSDRHSPLEITDFADRYVQDRLQTLPGVANVMIGGERRYAMRLWLDRERMAAHGVTAQDVEQALRSRNAEFPGGRIESHWREFTVLSQTDLRSADEFNELLIRPPQLNGPQQGELAGGVRLRDIGRAELGAADERNKVRVNGNPAVGLGVVKQSTANALAVARAVKAALPDIRRGLPEGMALKVAFDSSLFIEESIKGVYRTLGESLLLVTLVTFAFLRSWRATLIPLVTIPVSLVGAFIFIYALDFSVNTLTLLALVLAIGLVVDDAIVMLENIHRRMEGGMDAMEAAFSGSREIAFAVIAMTITLAAVFAPLAFMTGKTGRLFSEFALAVSCAVLVSGFVALTLTPMMCSRLLRRHEGGGDKPIDGGAMAVGYGRLLGLAMRGRGWIAVGFAAVVGLGVWLLLSLPTELSPLEDRSNFLALISAPEGATMDYTDQYARQVEELVLHIPEMSTAFLVVAPGLERPNPVNSALAFVTLRPWEQRERKQQDITAELSPQLMDLPGVRAFALNPPSFGQSFRSLPVQFVLQGRNYQELQQAMAQLQMKAAQIPGLINLDSDLKLDKPQLGVRVRRDKALDMGVDIDAIGTSLQTLLGGRQVTRFKREGQLYDVILQMRDESRNRPEDIGLIQLRGKNGRLTPLSNLLDISEGVAPKELNHFNRLRSATLSATLAPGYALGDALAALRQLAETTLPSTVTTDLDGQSREFQESSSALYLMFWAALLFIYLVLAAQFESYLDPLIILFTVPLSIAGAMLSLKLVGGTISVYSQVGMVMLVGLITKNGILIVEFANQLRAQQGLDAAAAVARAALLRLRPIAMTSLTMILGAVPLALASGAGAEGRQQIGWVIVGGLLLGTLLTMFVIPVAYSAMTRHRDGTAAARV
jgi:multidrug efflux pump